MKVSLLFSLLAFGALTRWANDTSLVAAAERWQRTFEAERCAWVAARDEAGRRNIEAAAAVRGTDPAGALERWAAMPWFSSCPQKDAPLKWDLAKEHHPNDEGVNWVVSWHEGG